jgi:hypothetical protein
VFLEGLEPPAWLMGAKHVSSQPWVGASGHTAHTWFVEMDLALIHFKQIMALL